jgi:hypothetical protein
MIVWPAPPQELQGMRVALVIPFVRNEYPDVLQARHTGYLAFNAARNWLNALGGMVKIVQAWLIIVNFAVSPPMSGWLALAAA